MEKNSVLRILGMACILIFVFCFIGSIETKNISALGISEIFGFTGIGLLFWSQKNRY